MGFLGVDFAAQFYFESPHMTSFAFGLEIGYNGAEMCHAAGACTDRCGIDGRPDEEVASNGFERRGHRGNERL